MIEVQNLTKRFRDLVAVDDISFTVNTGDILGFLGRNGAGKTTTMRMITGFISPTAGSVRIDGRSVFDEPHVKSQIGYLPETPPLYLDMTPRSYLNHVADLKGIPHRDIQKQIQRACDRCGIAHVQDRVLSHLSKGYKQRVGLAQALLGNPKILILDEPTVGLDPAQIREIRGLIQELAQEHTVILSTHILGEVQLICNRVIIINGGTIIVNDTLEGLSRRDGRSDRVRISLHEANKQIESALQNQKELAKVQTIVPHKTYEVVFKKDDHQAQSSLLKQLVSAGYPILEYQIITPSLEEIFLRTIRDDVTKTSQHSETEHKPPQQGLAEASSTENTPATSSSDKTSSEEPTAETNQHSVSSAVTEEALKEEKSNDVSEAETTKEVSSESKEKTAASPNKKNKSKKR